LTLLYREMIVPLVLT